MTGSDRIDQDADVEAVVHGPGGGERHSASAARRVRRSRGHAHRAPRANPSNAPVRLLNLNTPSAFEAYVRALADAAREEPLTSEALGRIDSRGDLIPA